MIDLHTHTLLSDGALVPTELIRRAYAKGYKAIAITDHVDDSNIDFVVPRTVKVCKKLSGIWDIKMIPGCELTHVPPERFSELIEEAKRLGAKLILIHGETLAEPVVAGTNRKALESDIAILTHPGLISLEDAKLARDNGIYLEITARSIHASTNSHVVEMARKAGASLVLNTDAHEAKDLVTDDEAREVARAAGLGDGEIAVVFENSKKIVEKVTEFTPGTGRT